VVASKQTKLNVAVVGSGTMGTALAHVVASAGHACTLLTQDIQVMDRVNAIHQHPAFFKGLQLHSQIRAAIDWQDPVSSADLIVMAVPSYAMRAEAQRIAVFTHANQSVLSVTKGFEAVSHKLMSHVLHEELSTQHGGTLSGPNITLDLVKNLPTELVIASASAQMRAHGQLAFTSPTVKILTSEDIQSYEYVSALKNIVALEVGVVTGLGLGDNFRALVFAKGMAEISQLLEKMGLQAQTFYGLGGLSDIFLTCSSHFAQNYAIGVQRGAGVSLAALSDTLKAKGETAEGLEALNAGLSLAQQYSYTAPLLEATHTFVYGEGDFNKNNFVSAAFDC
jgi:glycerol-3-phosphate dehydrogenase (NAD(P)+)